MQTGLKKAGRQPDKGAGRHSYLIALLVIAGVILFFSLSLWGVSYLFRGSQNLALGGEGVGVIEINGIITESDAIIEALTTYERSDKVKAIVLRINSPGGGVAATQEIYQEINRTKKKKKIVVSMGSMAASGGLYISAPADKILANPSTVTGSIGVIMHIMNMEDLMGKLGIRPVVVKSGKFKDIGSGTRVMTEEEKELLQSLIDEMHQQFVSDLAKGRGLDPEKVGKLADGRIYTGNQALKFGLIDKIGNLEDAINLAGEMAGLSKPIKVIRPKKKESWWLGDLLGQESPLKNILPTWTKLPVSFQYLYWPGI